MKSLRTHRHLTLISPVTPSHPSEIHVRYSDSGEERLLDVAVVIFETDEESRAALGKPLNTEYNLLSEIRTLGRTAATPETILACEKATPKTKARAMA